jgi:hypothetical protein
MQTFIDSIPISQKEDAGGVSGGKTTAYDEDFSADCQMMC